jgi:starch synthase (maltosyl-transferring)
MVDLVINHTAKDNPLVASRPGWYRWDAQGELMSPSAIDPANADNVTVWGDLAEIDNNGAADRDELWTFWERLLFQFMDVGFTGFRCDAAYKVPAALWERLIARPAPRGAGSSPSAGSPPYGRGPGSRRSPARQDGSRRPCRYGRG